MRRYLFIVAVLSVIAYTILWYAFPRSVSTSELSVYVLDVGQGDAIYVRAPDGSDVLIDGGPRGSLLSPLQQVMPFDDRKIDVLIVTNPDTDHYAGFLDLLKEYEIGIVVEAGTRSGTKTYQEFESRIAEKQIPKLIAQKGMRIILDQDSMVVFEVLFPDRDVSVFSTNDGSMVGTLSYGSRHFLFTGDATSYTESLLLTHPEKLDADVLKVGHHGSRTSTSSAFLRAVTPAYSLVSTGKNNRYGHPHPEVTSRLKKLGTTMLGTYENGTILCTTDGSALVCK
jgi:beta-lactamase superfamily II metal-dependent hydrolase